MKTEKDKDLDYASITEEVLTKDDIARKIATEAEIDQFEEDKLDRTWYGCTIHQDYAQTDVK